MAGCVFDFDGVLVDSMPRHAEAYRRVLAPFGLRVRDEQIFTLEGGRSESIIRGLLEEAGAPQPPEAVARLSQEKQRVYASLGTPPLYPGAEALVRRVRACVERMGLVTGTRRENLERLIPHLIPLFDSALAQENYTRDKPDPEPYAKSAAALRLEPARLAALENAVRGVRSARNAGYGYVLGITTTMGAERLKEAGAHAVAHSHEEAAQLLCRWAARA